MTDTQQAAKDRGYWSVVELAEAAGVTVGRIRQVLGAGELQGVKAGRAWLIPYDIGVTWLAKRETSE